MVRGELRLRVAWRAAMANVGATRSPAAVEAALDGLVARYREPHRRYHGVAHLVAVVDHVEHLAAVESGLDAPARGAVTAAAVFHDAIYDPRSPQNEAASADLADRSLADLGCPPAIVARCADLVRATAHPAGGAGGGGGEAPADLATGVLLDADLAVLGAPPSAYEAYVRGVRAEYAFVDEASWRAGRAAVLASFLGRPHIYATATMRSSREHRARANLTTEHSSLS